MKNILNKWTTFVFAGASITCLIGCNDDFLEEKKLWGKYSEATVYTNYETATNRIDNIYYMLYPGQGEGLGSQASLISTGTEDVWAKTTEEYGGLSNWENSTLIKTYNDVEDHFYIENKETSPYGHVREINEVIENVQKYSKGHLTDEQINNILGQAYFLRAWRYYLMVRWYGGVPIIDKVQDAIVGNGEGLDLVVPRSSTKKCIQFICNDLDKAAKLLPLQWENEAEDWGRVTAGTALALKGVYYYIGQVHYGIEKMISNDGKPHMKLIKMHQTHQHQEDTDQLMKIMPVHKSKVQPIGQKYF